MDITLPNSVENPVIDIWFNKNEQKQKLNEFLVLFARLASANADYTFEVFPILNAKVPIIKVTAFRKLPSSKSKAKTRKKGKKYYRKGPPMDIDIAIQSSQQSVAQLISFYCAYDWRVRPVLVCVKHWAKMRKICDAMSNYPNSFGFVLLCIKFLQMVGVLPVMDICEHAITSSMDAAEPILVANISAHNPASLVELVTQFFEMYHRFNFKLLQVATSRVGLESKICHEYYGSFCRLHQTTMVVEDPSCRAANVCRN